MTTTSVNRAVAGLLAMAVMVFSPVASQALPIVTGLDIANKDLGISGVYATVTVELTGTDTVQFTVDADETLLGAGDSFGIQSFGFNTTLDLATADFSLPTGWYVEFDVRISDFGIFRDDTTGGDIDHRVDPLVFTITFDGISSENQFYVANSEGYHYAAHIGGFTNATTGIVSAKFSETQPVPEPAAFLLLGSGLLGAALWRRKRS